MINAVTHSRNLALLTCGVALAVCAFIGNNIFKATKISEYSELKLNVSQVVSTPKTTESVTKQVTSAPIEKVEPPKQESIKAPTEEVIPKKTLAKTEKVLPPKKEVIRKPVQKQVLASHKVKKTKTITKTKDVATVTQAQAVKEIIKAPQEITSSQKQDVYNRLTSLLKYDLVYPKLAIRRGMQGLVLIEFKLNQGKVESYTLAKSSGHNVLDEAALKIASNLINKDVTNYLGSTKLNVPIKYELN